MSQIAMRLVRVQDRLTNDGDSVWRINPRTGILESRAGLSWTGVRDYMIGGKRVKVLHRPEQFNSPAFLRTLRRLPSAKGHPSGGRDVLTSNASELLVGWTGEAIDVEEHGGYPRPVGNASVFVPSVICEMVDRDSWDAYCAAFPDVAKLELRHSGAPPKTGTSLGYNALWYGPHVEAEIVSERDDGSLVGEWMGPNGPERYDIEHIVDPECEVVRKLVENTGFDDRVLGGQHFAVCLPALGGRGAEQSELMRVVDAVDLPAIDPDHARRFARVAVQVPVMPALSSRVKTKVFDAAAVDPRWAVRQEAVREFVASHAADPTTGEPVREYKTIPKCSVTYGTNEYGVLETSFHFDGDAEPLTTAPNIPLDEVTKEFIVDLYLWSRDPHDELVGPNGEELATCKIEPATDSAERRRVRIFGRARDASWTVGTSRELPIVPGDWDGDAAAASVFAWAGFDGDKPDPAKAREAFLIYDADEPELKGSYKLPIARYRVGRLEAVSEGLQAAARYLPQTDAPQDVLDRARGVLDLYFDKWRKQQPARDKIMNKTSIEIGLGRDAVKALAKLAPAIKAPTSITLALDEIDAEKLRMKLDEMAGIFGDLMEMVSEAKGDMEGMKEQMADMMTAAEAQKKVDEVKAQLKAVEEALTEATAAETAAKDKADKMKAACDSLTAELAPFRAAEFKSFRDEAIARGIDKAKVEAAKDAAELRRTIVVAKLGERYGKCRDDGSFVADDTLVQAAFDGVWLSLAAAKPAAPASPSFGLPRIGLEQRDAAQGQPVQSTKAVVKAGAVCL